MRFVAVHFRRVGYHRRQVSSFESRPWRPRSVMDCRRLDSDSETVNGFGGKTLSKNRFLGCLMILAALIILGSSFIAAKAMVETMPTFLALSFRTGGASLILIPVLFMRERGLPDLTRSGWGLIVLQGLIGVVLFNILLFSGLERTTAGFAGIAFGMLPIVIGLLAWMCLGERMTGTKIAALACAAIGTIQLNFNDFELRLLSGAAIGNMLVVAAVGCEGLFTILGKRLSGRCSPLSLAALVSVASFIMVLPLAVRDAIAFDFSQVSKEDWLTLGWWALASGVGYFFLFYAGLNRVDATTVGISTVTLPVTTVLLSNWLLQEPLGLSHVIGLFCAATGIILVFAPPSITLRALFRNRQPIHEISAAPPA